VAFDVHIIPQQTIKYLIYFQQLTSDMKTLGIILIVAGIAMILFRGFNLQTEKRVVDIGPVQIDKKENRWIGWPTYAGAVVAVIGVVLVASEKKRT
jgi:drug/metabolite transporter (DMT)-like permease